MPEFESQRRRQKRGTIQKGKTMEWHDLRKEKPTKTVNDVFLKIEIPAYFECDDKKRNTHLLLDLENLLGINKKGLFPFPIDLKSDQKKWKWKINPVENEHYEDFLTWIDKEKNIFMPDNYCCYPKDYKNEWKTFENELPALGTNIIVSIELYGKLTCKNNEFSFYWDSYVAGYSPLGGFSINFDLSNPNISWYWQNRWEQT